MYNELKSTKGMSLIEVMVAITMLAFITLGIISITENATQVKEITVDEDREMLQIEKAFYRFSFDFEQIYSPLFFSNKMKRETKKLESQVAQAKNNLIGHYKTQEDFNSISESGEIIPKLYTDGKATFGFYTMSNRRKYQNAKESTYSWVLYKLEKKEILDEFNETISTQAFVRYYSANNPFEQPIWEKLDDLKSQILLINVTKLEFKFWDPKREKYISDLKVIKDGAHLVRGIQVELTWTDRNENELSTTRYFKPAWDYFVPETDDEILKLQEQIKQYGKKIGDNSTAGGSSAP